MLALQADGTVVETVESLAAGEAASPLQEAFVEEDAVQCGSCTSGMLLASKALLDRNPTVSDDEVRDALSGNACRCTGYGRIVAAVQRAAPRHRASLLPTPPDPVAPSYYRPRSLEEALEVLLQRGGEVRPIAGGTHIMPAVHAGQVRGQSFFDLGLVTELSGIEADETTLRLGASTTLAEAAASDAVRCHAAVLAEAVRVSAGPQRRNRGTLGGALASGLADSDVAPALVALDATVELVSLSDRRLVPVAELFLAPGETLLAPDELILEVRVPLRQGLRATLQRVTRRAGPGPAKISVAVAMCFAEGRPSHCRVAIGGVSLAAQRVTKTEEALLSGGFDGLQRAMDIIRDEAEPLDDERSTAFYRREMASVLLRRAVMTLVEG
jgi:CO/xanthine dehydrogenase FAD-binding subunit